MSSTDILGIGSHEMGHIIARQYGEKGVEFTKTVCYNLYGKEMSNVEALEFLEKNISEYSNSNYEQHSSRPFKQSHYHEIIPEVIAKDITNPDNFTNEFIKIMKEQCGI